MNPRCRLTLLLLTTASVLGVSNSGSAQCPDWNPDFRLPGPAAQVTAMTAFDAGSGPVLYVGGAFTDAEGVPANHIAKWDGSDWSALGSGLDGGVTALTVFDDGTGPAIYAAGSFGAAGGQPANHIAKWDGSAWSALGSGTDGTILALAVFDDGSGPALYAGGSFTIADGTAANHVAKWDGAAWSAVAEGTDGAVAALIVFQDGSGSALYAGGQFTTAGMVPANDVGKWDGLAWSALGSGVDNGVASFAVFDEGSGPALHAGFFGVFEWDGVNWLPVGANTFVEADSLTAFDDGTGPALYAGSTQSVDIQKWDGATWSTLPRAPDHYGWGGAVLGAFDDGHGSALYAGFDPEGSPFSLPLCFARWGGGTWIPVGRALGLTDGAMSLAVFDDGSGAALYAGGRFPAAGDIAASHVAKYDGLRWSALGGGIAGDPYITSVNALAAFDDGSGPALYAGGWFTSAGGVPANDIAKWNGSDWSALGLGLDGAQQYGVRALTVFADGTGSKLYAGGEFTAADGQPANHVAKWDGSLWSTLDVGTDGPVLAMTVFDDGSGPALYVGGLFANAGGAPANGIAKWDGSTWAPLAAGVPGGVVALTVFDDGTGAALFAARASTQANLLKWNGSTWSSVPNPPGGGGCGATALGVFDDGVRPAIYMGTSGCTKPFGAIKRWDGSSWAEVGPLVFGSVASFATFENPEDATPGLYMALGAPALLLGDNVSGIAEVRGCTEPGVAFCFGDGTGAACPCGNSGAPGHGCENSATTGGAVLESSGMTSLAFDSLRLTCRGERATALSVFVQGSLQVAQVVYGDGLRCFGGQAKRLFIKAAVGGVVSAPQSGDPSVSARSAALGDPLHVGSTRVYQTYYRDPEPSFCPNPPGSTWNISNARKIQWLP